MAYSKKSTDYEAGYDAGRSGSFPCIRFPDPDRPSTRWPIEDYNRGYAEGRKARELDGIKNLFKSSLFSKDEAKENNSIYSSSGKFKFNFYIG